MRIYWSIILCSLASYSVYASEGEELFDTANDIYQSVYAEQLSNSLEERNEIVPPAENLDIADGSA